MSELRNAKSGEVLFVSEHVASVSDALHDRINALEAENKMLRRENEVNKRKLRGTPELAKALAMSPEELAIAKQRRTDILVQAAKAIDDLQYGPDAKALAEAPDGEVLFVTDSKLMTYTPKDRVSLVGVVNGKVVTVKDADTAETGVKASVLMETTENGVAFGTPGDDEGVDIVYRPPSEGDAQMEFFKRRNHE